MSSPRAKAIYKKKEGVIAVSDDQMAVTWTPGAGTGAAAVSLDIETITNLQQAPDSSPKVMLKIFAKPPSEGGEPISYLFHFTSAENARTEANAVKGLLSRLISQTRNGSPAPAKPAAGGPAATNGTADGGGAGTRGLSGSVASLSKGTATSKAPASGRWFGDSQLKADIELQQSLMKKDKALHQTYMEARSTKPELISDAAFNTQFWSSRTGLLRAHAIETSQRKGVYNVLSTVKPHVVDGELRLHISVEQVQLIFAQHPLVKRIYNEAVPKLPEAQFWSRFFLSKLAKRLRGERPDDKESDDPLFDHHSLSENALRTGGTQGQDQSARHGPQEQRRLPHIINVYGNDENQGGFRGGNLPDEQMRSDPTRSAARTINSMSEKMLAHVAPADQDPVDAFGGGGGGGGMDERTLRELSLRDLRGEAEPDHVALNVREQARFFSQNAASGASADRDALEKQDPVVALAGLRADLAALDSGWQPSSSSPLPPRQGGGIDLHGAIGIDDVSDSDEESQGGRRKRSHVGSRDSRAAAQAQVWEGLTKRRAESGEQTEDEAATPMGLSTELTHKVLITNATTNEFLKQFWVAFLSGDADRAQELAYHVEALRKSEQRIEAVAAEAEEVRQKAIAEKKSEIRAYWQRTKKKLKWSEDRVGGGRPAVMTLVGPTLGALKTAQERYQEAIAAEGIRPLTEEA